MTTLVVGATALMLDERKAAWKHTVLAAACAIKLTAVEAVTAIAVFLAIGLRQPRRAIGLGPGRAMPSRSWRCCCRCSSSDS